MAAAAGEEIRGSGDSQEQVAGGKSPSPSVASGTGAGTASAHSGETCSSTDASPAQKLMDELKKSKEEIPNMDKAEVLAFEEHLRALRRSLLQRIKEEEDKAAAAAAAAEEPRRAG